jgi:hypothetical protein
MREQPEAGNGIKGFGWEIELFNVLNLKMDIGEMTIF